ncbi:MAG: DNA-directed RNA polymerase subunit L [Candidatus Micrarchaeota archaeon]|nr:DNA-directed RNA polymerase subunit L [Candidatus Micrarchaeota archaeon]
MDIEIVKSEKNYVEIQVLGDDYGVAAAIKELLLDDKDVEFAAYRVDHPQIGKPILMVRTKEGNPISSIKYAIKKLRKQATDFKDAIKEAKKPKKS